MNKPRPKAYAIPAPKNEKTYQAFNDQNLRDFAEKYSRAYNNDKIDEKLILNFFEH